MKRQVQVFSELHRESEKGCMGNSHSHCKESSKTLPGAKLRETNSGRNSAEVIKKKDSDQIGCGYVFGHAH